MPYLKTIGYTSMKKCDAVNQACYLIPKFQESQFQWTRGLQPLAGIVGWNCAVGVDVCCEVEGSALG
jgi:hypothetical protein